MDPGIDLCAECRAFLSFSLPLSLLMCTLLKKKKRIFRQENGCKWRINGYKWRVEIKRPCYFGAWLVVEGNESGVSGWVQILDVPLINFMNLVKKT